MKKFQPVIIALLSIFVVVGCCGGVENWATYITGRQTATAPLSGTDKIPILQNRSSVRITTVNQLLEGVYTTGSFTPAIQFTTGSTGITYSIQQGIYTKIGNQVTIEGMVVLSNKGSSTGGLSITGLPFASNSSANIYPTITLHSSNTTGITKSIWGLVSPNTTAVTVYVDDQSLTNMLDSNTTNTTTIFFSGTYITN